MTPKDRDRLTALELIDAVTTYAELVIQNEAIDDVAELDPDTWEAADIGWEVAECYLHKHSLTQDNEETYLAKLQQLVNMGRPAILLIRSLRTVLTR